MKMDIYQGITILEILEGLKIGQELLV